MVADTYWHTSVGDWPGMQVGGKAQGNYRWLKPGHMCKSGVALV